MLGHAYYKTFDEAYQVASSEGADANDIILLNDVYVDDTVVVGEGGVELYLNGHEAKVNGNLTITGGEYINGSIVAGTGSIVITGGTFSYGVVDQDWIAPGYKAVDNGDGTFTVVEKKNVYVNVTLSGADSFSVFVNDDEAFTVSGNDSFTVEEGNEVTVTPVYDETVTVEGWYVDGYEDMVSADEYYTFTAETKDVALLVKFVEAQETERKVVAMVGDNKYTSFTDAYSDATNTATSTTIELLSDVTIGSGTSDDPESIENVQRLRLPLTVNMNGSTITVSGSLEIIDGTYNGTFNVPEGSTLTIHAGVNLSEYPDDSWLAAGCAAFENEDGTYTVKEAATITGKNLNGKGSSTKAVLVKGDRARVEAVENLVSNSYSYSFIANEDVTLTAKYAEAKQDSVAELSFTASRYDTNSKIYYQAVRNVTGYTVKEAGILYGTSATLFGDESSADENLRIGLSKVYKKTSSVTTNNGYYTYTLNIGSANTSRTVYARAYVIVVDEDGNETEIYSEVVSKSFKELKTPVTVGNQESVED
jgi:hypothetical protein